MSVEEDLKQLGFLLKDAAELLSHTYQDRVFEEVKPEIENSIQKVINPYINLIESFEVTNHVTTHGSLKLKINLIPKKTGGRKLASIRKIKKLEPIKGADFIEKATVDGWTCIVKKNDFSEGDLGVFMEIDSFLKIESRYEFLRKSCYRKTTDGEEGFRIRTMKLRKCLSQGLMLPLKSGNNSLFPELIIQIPKELKIGQDVTELLNVTKWNPPIPMCLRGQVKDNFPSYIMKTDQERIQNLPDYFEIYKDVKFEETEKLDGSSMTVYFNEEEFGVCSRNLDLKEDDKNLFWKTALKYNLKELLPKLCKDLSKNLALQGEVIGPGIRGNNYKLEEHEYRIFDIWDIDNQVHLTSMQRASIIMKIPTLKQVPMLGIKHIFNDNNMEGVLEYVKGNSALNIKTKREGIVFKSIELINGEVLSFKAINNDYLLKCEFEHEGGERK